MKDWEVFRQFCDRFESEYGVIPSMSAQDSRHGHIGFQNMSQFVFFRPHTQMYTLDEQYELIVHQIRTHIIKQTANDSHLPWDEIMFDGYFPGHTDITDKVTGKIHDLNLLAPSIPMYVEHTSPPSHMGDTGVILVPNAVHADDIAVSEVYELTDRYVSINYCKIILSGAYGKTEKFYDRMKMDRVTGEFSMEGKLDSYPQWLDSINSKYDLYQNPNNRPAWDKIVHVEHYDGKDIFVDWENKYCYVNTEFGWSCMDLNYARSYIKHSELDAAVNIRQLALDVEKKVVA